MKRLRKYHKWPSLLIGFFLILFSVSGIVLNHREFFANINLSRRLMPASYHLSNWNLAIVKGSLDAGNGRIFLYGNAGIWETDSLYHHFTGFSNGLGRGMDHRKTFTMLCSRKNRLFAGTLYGLYRYNENSGRWQKIQLPERSPGVVRLNEYAGSIYVMTRNHLYCFADHENPEITSLNIPAPGGNDGKAGLFRTLWTIHSGELFGITGRLIADIVALTLIFISLSGYFYTALPAVLKRVSIGLRFRLQKTNRISIKWHTRTGVYGLAILTVTVVSGMFLRPPLLIPVASARVAPISGTLLADPNFWRDKFRDFTIDSSENRLILSSSEGFFETGIGDFAYCRSFPLQPPVSVMGITAFERMDDGTLLVGSFSGLYRWDASNGMVQNMITGEPVTRSEQGNPFGSTAVAGVLFSKHRPFALLDYDAGWIPVQAGSHVPAMPEEIKNTPASLWNFSLEVHTGRIFSVFLGDFYILYVPLMGLTTLLIFITGFLMWNKKRKRKKQHIHPMHDGHENYKITGSA